MSVILPIEVMHRVCRYMGVEPEIFRSVERGVNTVAARWITYYLCRKYTTRSFPEIARDLGVKSHSSVVVGVQQYKDRMGRDGVLRMKVGHKRVDITNAGSVVDSVEAELERVA